MDPILLETAITNLQTDIERILKHLQPQRLTHRDWILQAFEHNKTLDERTKMELAGYKISWILIGVDVTKTAQEPLSSCSARSSRTCWIA